MIFVQKSELHKNDADYMEFMCKAPVGGETAEHAKMAAYLIFKRPLKVISKQLAQLPELKGNGHLQIFRAIFTAMRGGPTGEHRDRLNSPQMRRLP